MYLCRESEKKIERPTDLFVFNVFDSFHSPVFFSSKLINKR